MIQDYEAVARTVIERAVKVFDIPAERIQAFQRVCIHPTGRWIEVENVPLEARQYSDDRDWLCLVCGALVPCFK